MIVFVVKIALLGLLVYAAFRVLWAGIVAAAAKLLEMTINLVAKLKVAIRKGGHAIFYLIRRFADGRTVMNQIGKSEPVDILPDELEELLKKQEEEKMIHVKDENTGW